LKWDDLVKAATTRSEAVRVVRTAVNPLLWLAGIVTPLATIAVVVVSDSWVRGALLALAALPVFAALVAYFTLLFRDPDRLQSEEFRLRQAALRILYSKPAEADIVDAVQEVVRYRDLPGAEGGER
jgi:hypothetical protein